MHVIVIKRKNINEHLDSTLHICILIFYFYFQVPVSTFTFLNANLQMRPEQNLLNLNQSLPSCTCKREVTIQEIEPRSDV